VREQGRFAFDQQGADDNRNTAGGMPAFKMQTLGARPAALRLKSPVPSHDETPLTR